MTADELSELAPGTSLYIPGATDVTHWILDRRVLGRDYYTVLFPDGDDGKPITKKPHYLHLIDLLEAQTEEVVAWQMVRDEVIKNLETINKRIELLTNQANE
ncbi:hypothetical protein [Spirosoma sordidisoli]|uniref:Uncharacterized protein n=1 Tax=Spirosoma sordidisoli TaxID=2502893 RepID=A0A4Q2UKD5_9BACT|nr:hypothetical protein [Spirosoma sordidisoli]RYC69666.1 hypothetical protein EQG79_13780 [Spirosoma sordidisoli]